MQALPDKARAVLELWFGELDSDGLADSDHTKRWFEKNPDFDARLRAEFGDTHARLAQGLPEDWQAARARLAAVIVLDQFSRNMFRGTGDMFAFDGRALEIARVLVESAELSELRTHEKLFAYMPFMHSEALDDQRLCLERLVQLRDASPPKAAEALESNVVYAKRHLEIVERFGRFPHRNALLGRDSSAEERAFLEEPGSSF